MAKETEQYELRFDLIRVEHMQLKGKVEMTDVLTIDFEPEGKGKYIVMNLEGPDAWIGEHETKLGAIVEYLKARLGVR